MPDPIYLDYAATTPVLPEVIDAMLPWFGEQFGNPGSVHRWGQKADAALNRARRDIAAVLNCAASEVVFTGAGSEADNLALRGVMMAAHIANRGNHFITTNAEHEAVLATAEQLAAHYGFDLTILPVDAFGQVSATQVAAAIRHDTVLVSVIWGNNEIGTLNDLPAIAEVCRALGVLLHSDGLQAAGQLNPDVTALGVDLLSIGAHKFYGPKGVGALYVRSGVDLLPSQTGGGQEGGLRAGTSNVPLAVGMAAAFTAAHERRDAQAAHYRHLRDMLIDGICQRIPDVRLTGHPTARLPNHASFVFRGIDGNDLLMQLDLAGIAASSGSACKTGNPEPSAVIRALGIDDEWGLGSLRLTVGRHTTESDIAFVLDTLPGIVARMRG